MWNMDAGMSDCAVKPLNHETLTEVLSRNLPSDLLAPSAPSTPGRGPGCPRGGLRVCRMTGHVWVGSVRACVRGGDLVTMVDEQHIFIRICCVAKECNVR